MTSAPTLETLLSVKDKDREPLWEEQFLAAFCSSNIRLLENTPQQGPDSWPYMLVKTGEDATEPAGKLLAWLADKGIGLVVNPEKQPVDYVFTWGMIWNFKETGRFFKPPEEQRTTHSTLIIEPNSKIIAGPPSPEYLPAYVRELLKAFLNDQGVADPKILVISENGKDFDLCFSLESLGNPPTQERKGVAEALSWFLPLDYSVVLISENGLPKFVDL